MAILRSHCAPAWGKHLWVAAIAIAIFSTPGFCRAQGIGPHFGFGYLGGEDVGLDDGYSYFDAFVPLSQPSSTSLLFGNVRGLLYNDQSDALGANAGLGLRWLDGSKEVVWGTYFYYDYRDLEIVDFDQLSWGLEALGSRCEARFNAYAIVGEDAQFIGLQPRFVNQNIALDNVFLRALHGWDTEVGTTLFARGNMQIKGFAGAYGFYDDRLDNAVGPRGRLELRANDQLFVGGYVQNDDLRGTTGGFSIEWRFGCPCRSRCSSQNDLACRLGDPVRRRQHIAVETELRDTGTLATVGNVPITVLHASTTGSGANTGGVDDPVTLAQITGSTQDIAFVHGGVYDGESIVVTQAGQRLLADGENHLFASDQGTFSLPTLFGNVEITNAPGHAIEFNVTNVEVAGFRITNPGLSGIVGSGIVDGYNINRNTVSGALTLGEGAIVVANAGAPLGVVANNVTTNNAGGIAVAGGTSVTDNIANNSGGGMVVGNLTGDVSGNTANGNAGVGILLGAVGGDVRGNTANDNGIVGILNLTGDIAGEVANNVTNGNGDGTFLSGGLILQGHMGGDITGNVANDNFGFGFVLLEVNEANLPNRPDVVGNTALRNAGSGIMMDIIAADVVGNRTNANGEGGILIRQGIIGNIENNEANGNVGFGITVLDDAPNAPFAGGVEGNVTGNTTNNNLAGGMLVDFLTGGTYSSEGDGMCFSDVTGDVINNTSNFNADDGIDVDGAVGGASAPNTLIGNGDQGLEN